MRAWFVPLVASWVLLAGLAPLDGTTSHSSLELFGEVARAKSPDRPIGPALPSTIEIPLTIALAPANLSRLQGLLLEQERPGSPEYRQFLSAPAFERSFRPSATSIEAVDGYLHANGASHLTVSPDGFGLTLDLPAGGVASAWGVHLDLAAEGPFGLKYAPSGTPEWPANLAPLVSGIDGLNDSTELEAQASLFGQLHRDLATAHRASLSEFVADPNDSAQLAVGSDLDQVYGVTGLFPGAPTPNATFANHEAIATLLFSSYNLTVSRDLPPFDPTVLTQFFNSTLPPAWPQPNISGVPITINGVTAPAPGSLENLSDDSLSEAENSLDLEMAGSAAPGADLVNFYIPQSQFLSVGPSGTPNSDLADAMADALGTALNYSYGSARLVAVSNSYGLPDLNDSLWNVELEHAAAMGVSVLAASGDQGDAPDGQTGRDQGSTPVWPATSAFESSGVLAVGGTSLTLLGPPTSTFESPNPLNLSYDGNITGYSGESVWYTTAGGVDAGSEGGVSTVYAEPAWERGSAAQPTIVNATLEQGASALGRAVPDAALDANDLIDVYANNSTGTYFSIVSGTSASSPYLAGVLAECAAVAGHPFGYLDPLWYRIGSFFGSNPSNSTNPFHEVVNGSNYLFSAGPGWNAATGWGSINATRLLAALDSPAIANFTYSGPSPGLPPPPPPPTPPSSAVTPTLAIVFAALAVGLVFALFVAIRFETEPVQSPPRLTDGPMQDGPRPPPVRSLCPRCGHERPVGSFVCPFCGAF
jgi:subtilase family serine protease